MSIGEICKREVVIVQREDAVLQAAKLMRQHHVGDVVVVDDRDGKRVPVGIVTDRDLVVEVIAPELNPNTITVGDIMVSDFATIRESAGVFESIQYMRIKGVRRMPVVDDDSNLIGIVTLDDLLALLSEELDALVKLMAHEQQKEAGTRR
ncbi:MULTISPECIES: CBS domain-containing protein [unclassified Nitrosomonas]|jgi:signal-transduction protein with cAMP-binding, CBS, and nucleotidyltransferase domain|uniref:CBS domain-containing protein n=1 Tax=unclassified Nitrosomonas TaxID=2609265 RepID=UPI0008840D18|nr:MULTISPECIES: CBS domain-containing protein [unclassified Nitrosomonas]SDH71964.1 CBS domain-containing protein [Nitrosomonas sp. Nm132]SDY82644.1 CBS domain-containing protein [Nitrosomonas sp. Nm58]